MISFFKGFLLCLLVLNSVENTLGVLSSQRNQLKESQQRLVKKVKTSKIDKLSNSRILKETSENAADKKNKEWTQYDIGAIFFGGSEKAHFNIPRSLHLSEKLPSQYVIPEYMRNLDKPVFCASCLKLPVLTTTYPRLTCFGYGYHIRLMYTHYFMLFMSRAVEELKEGNNYFTMGNEIPTISFKIVKSNMNPVSKVIRIYPKVDIAEQSEFLTEEQVQTTMNDMDQERGDLIKEGEKKSFDMSLEKLKEVEEYLKKTDFEKKLSNAVNAMKDNDDFTNIVKNFNDEFKDYVAKEMLDTDFGIKLKNLIIAKILYEHLSYKGERKDITASDDKFNVEQIISQKISKKNQHCDIFTMAFQFDLKTSSSQTRFYLLFKYEAKTSSFTKSDFVFRLKTFLIIPNSMSDDLILMHPQEVKLQGQTELDRKGLPLFKLIQNRHNCYAIRLNSNGVFDKPGFKENGLACMHTIQGVRQAFKELSRLKYSKINFDDSCSRPIKRKKLIGPPILKKDEDPKKDDPKFTPVQIVHEDPPELIETDNYCKELLELILSQNSHDKLSEIARVFVLFNILKDQFKITNMVCSEMDCIENVSDASKYVLLIVKDNQTILEMLLMVSEYDRVSVEVVTDKDKDKSNGDEVEGEGPMSEIKACSQVNIRVSQTISGQIKCFENEFKSGSGDQKKIVTSTNRKKALTSLATSLANNMDLLILYYRMQIEPINIKQMFYLFMHDDPTFEKFSPFEEPIKNEESSENGEKTRHWNLNEAKYGHIFDLDVNYLRTDYVKIKSDDNRWVDIVLENLPSEDKITFACSVLKMDKIQLHHGQRPTFHIEILALKYDIKITATMGSNLLQMTLPIYWDHDLLFGREAYWEMETMEYLDGQDDLNRNPTIEYLREITKDGAVTHEYKQLFMFLKIKYLVKNVGSPIYEWIKNILTTVPIDDQDIEGAFSYQLEFDKGIKIEKQMIVDYELNLENKFVTFNDAYVLLMYAMFFNGLVDARNLVVFKKHKELITEYLEKGYEGLIHVKETTTENHKTDIHEKKNNGETNNILEITEEKTIETKVETVTNTVKIDTLLSVFGSIMAGWQHEMSDNGITVEDKPDCFLQDLDLAEFRSDPKQISGSDESDTESSICGTFSQELTETKSEDGQENKSKAIEIVKLANIKELLLQYKKLLISFSNDFSMKNLKGYFLPFSKDSPLRTEASWIQNKFHADTYFLIQAFDYSIDFWNAIHIKVETIYFHGEYILFMNDPLSFYVEILRIVEDFTRKAYLRYQLTQKENKSEMDEKKVVAVIDEYLKNKSYQFLSPTENDKIQAKIDSSKSLFKSDDINTDFEKAKTEMTEQNKEVKSETRKIINRWYDFGFKNAVQSADHLSYLELLEDADDGFVSKKKTSDKNDETEKEKTEEPAKSSGSAKKSKVFILRFWMNTDEEKSGPTKSDHCGSLFFEHTFFAINNHDYTEVINDMLDTVFLRVRKGAAGEKDTTQKENHETKVEENLGDQKEEEKLGDQKEKTKLPVNQNDIHIQERNLKSKKLNTNASVLLRSSMTDKRLNY